MNIKDRIAAARHSAGIWVNAALLAAFPFASDIMQGVNDYLPNLAPYLPANVYKWVGFAVVVMNIARAVRKARLAAQAKAVANG